jgi:hypothetical protein
MHGASQRKVLAEQEVTTQDTSACTPACCTPRTVEELAQAIRALPLAERLKLFALVFDGEAK